MPVLNGPYLTASWVYNNEGQVTSITYPTTSSRSHTGMTLLPTYDSAGRLNAIGDNEATRGVPNCMPMWGNNAVYNAAGQLTSLTRLTSLAMNPCSEAYTGAAWSYNANGELLSASLGSTQVQYGYPAADKKSAAAVSIVNRVDILNDKILITNGRRGGYIYPQTLGWGPVRGALSQVLSQPYQYSWQAAYYAEEHILKDPFSDQGITTSFHHGTRSSTFEPYFVSSNSPNNFFGLPASPIVHNPTGIPPQSKPIRRPGPLRHPVI